MHGMTTPRPPRGRAGSCCLYLIEYSCTAHHTAVLNTDKWQIMYTVLRSKSGYPSAEIAPAGENDPPAPRRHARRARARGL